jgi:integrase
MAKKAAGLTAVQVQSKPAGMHADGNGLYLQVTTNGARSWIFRFQLDGKRRDMGLGSAAAGADGRPVVSLATARQKAADAKRLVAEGIDPIGHRDAERAAAAATAAKAMTFRQAAESYIEAMRPEWRNGKHADQWPSTLEAYVYPTLGGLAVSSIDAGLVRKVLAPIWTTKTETASRVRGRIEAILDYAKVQGARDGDNPARWAGNLEHMFPAKARIATVKHHTSLPYADLPDFWPRLQVQDGMGARALEFTILTACRSGEVLGARWDEIDTKAKVWIIPAGRMKAGAEHRVPLTDPALALLRKLAAIRLGELVFPGQSDGMPLSNMTMQATLRRMQVDATPHGFRATFRTWAAEKTDSPADVVEAALAHTQGKLTAAYQRGDLLEKRRELMAAWAAYVEGTP